MNTITFSAFDNFVTLLQFDLVCDRQWLLTQSQTYNMAGMLVGIFVFGWFGDRFVSLFMIIKLITDPLNN